MTLTANSGSTHNNIKNVSSPYYSRFAFLPLSTAGVVYDSLLLLYFYLSGTLKTVQRPLPRLSNLKLSSVSEQDGGEKVAIVTGSNTGIGYETAKCLVIDYGYTVIIACRSREKGEEAVKQINTSSEASGKPNGGKAVFVRPLDLSSFGSVREFCKEVQCRYQKKINILVNNAGVGSGAVYNDKTSDNYDLRFQSNFLGHFLLSSLLINDIIQSKGRIINLSSVWHHFCGGEGRLNDSRFWKEVALPDKKPENTYCFSKLASIFFTCELNRRYLKSKCICSIAVNPGGVNSDIWRYLPNNKIFRTIFPTLLLSTEQGCRPSVAACVLDDIPVGVKGDENCCYMQPYYLPGNPTDDVQTTPFPLMELLAPYQGYRFTRPRLPHGGSRECAEVMWKTCEELTGCSWPE